MVLFSSLLREAETFILDFTGRYFHGIQRGYEKGEKKFCNDTGGKFSFKQS